MGEIFLHIVGWAFSILGSITYLMALFFTFVSIVFFRFTHQKYWEEKATFFGLIALCTLPLGGLGGALLLLRNLHYSQVPHWNSLLVILAIIIYGALAFISGGYLLFKSQTRLD